MNLSKRIYRLLIDINRRTYQISCATIVSLTLLFGMNMSTFADTIYVDGSLITCGDGVGWSTAYRYLQDAIAAAQIDNDDEIWVKAGIYFVDQSCANPDGTSERIETFLLKKGVKLRGGFAGGEFEPGDRNLNGNVTILSGELFRPANGCGAGNGPDTLCCDIVCNDLGFTQCCDDNWDTFCADVAKEYCGEAYHVVTAGIDIDDPELTFIERFTIQDGVANGPGLHENEGGGMLILGEPGVIRCTFKENVAYRANSPVGRGSAMAIIGISIRPKLVNCDFFDNPGSSAFLVEEGGGLYNRDGNPQLTNCLFYNNIVPGNGGAIYNEQVNASPTTNGAMDLINCTIVENIASDGNSNGLGGGVFSTGGAFIDAENCIFFDNIDKDGQIESSQIYDAADNSIATFSMIEGCSGTGFCAIPGDGNIVGPPTYGTGFRLILASNGVDEGNPVGPLAGVPGDN